jgi:hypothetical protein
VAIVDSVQQRREGCPRCPQLVPAPAIGHPQCTWHCTLQACGMTCSIMTQRAAAASCNRQHTLVACLPLFAEPSTP